MTDKGEIKEVDQDRLVWEEEDVGAGKDVLLMLRTFQRRGHCQTD